VLHEFRMPDAGEGLTEAEVLSWRVSVGDAVAVNQVLLEVETAKAAVELPSPFAGTVVELLADPGQVVPVGAPIVRIDDGLPHDAEAEPTAEPTPTAEPEPTGQPGAPSATREPAATEPEAASHTEPAPPGTEPQPARGEPTGAGQGAVLVGYGVRSAPAPRRRPRITPHGTDHVEPGPPGAAARPVRHGGLEQARAVEERLGDGSVRAKPPVRRLARDLEVDLARVIPTGPGGTITHEDVERTAAEIGTSEVVPLPHVARMMARAMTDSAFSAPHVTEWVDVDVTGMTRFLAAARSRPEWSDVSLTPLTIAALGLVRAARAHPRINASLTESGEELLVHRGIHLGIAVDSARGLLVPHVPDAQDLDLRGMARALAVLVETARAGRARPEELRGSTITLTNVGALGMDGGTPILNPGEVAILALGRVLPRAWVVEGRVEPRDVVTLSLSFDHRVVDGALAAQVLRAVADFMADPATALALG
jgi:pyruvate dehydrogenase E2 component (dihydrolipoamide acetyltransferase)